MFFSIEGIDGSGKSTFIEAIKKEWPKHFPNKQLTIVNDPSSKNKESLLLRQIMKGEPPFDKHRYDPLSLAYMFIISRIELVRQEIQPALDAGHVVISDRFYHSNLAYQLCKASKIAKKHKNVLETAIKQSTLGVEPTRVFFMTLPLYMAKHRINKNRASKDKIEKELTTKDNISIDSYYLDIIRSMKTDTPVVLDALIPIEVNINIFFKELKEIYND